MEETSNPLDEHSILIKKTKRLVVFLVSIVFINITLAIVEPTGTTTDLTGTVVSPSDTKNAVVRLVIIGITVIGFLLGTIVSTIPYKKLSYQKKYLPASLICIFGLQVIFLILEIKYWFRFLL